MMLSQNDQNPHPPETKICNHCGFSTSNKCLLDANYCPRCGTPSIVWQECFANFFDRVPFAPDFAKAITLFHKHEFESSARTALIILEEKVRQTTKLDAHGSDLMSKALSYRVDPNGTVVEAPLIGSMISSRTRIAKNMRELSSS